MIRTVIVPYLSFPAISSKAFPSQTYIYRPAFLSQMFYRGKRYPKNFYSLVDSGSDNCMFPADFGRQIGINIEPGEEGPPLKGITGSGNVAFYHSIIVLLSLNGTDHSDYLELKCYAGFVDGLKTFGALGRNGFFSVCRSVKLNEMNRVIELEINDPQLISST